MSANVSTVTSKGRITIPKGVREALNITEKDRLLFVVEGDRVVLIPLRRRALSELYGSLPVNRLYPGQQTIRETIQKELGNRMAPGPSKLKKSPE